MNLKLFQFAVAYLAFACATSGFSQPGLALSKRSAAVKAAVEQLPTKRRISVVPIEGHEEFGTLIGHDDESFLFHDVDQDVDVALKYGAVKKVKKGYGGYNFANHRHVDRDKNLIASVCVLAGLALLIWAAAAAR